MKKRIITGIVIAAVLLTVCRFSDTPVFAVLFTFLSAIGVFEMLGCIGVRKEKRITVLSLLFSLLATLLAKIVTNESEYVSFLVSGAFLYLLLLFAFSVFSKGKVPVDDVFATFATTFYIVLAFTSIILLRSREFGEYLILIAIFMPLISDVFAYFCGVFFGKHKPIPEVSPKKTVEGSIGGMFFCGLSCSAFGAVTASLIGNKVGIILVLRMFAVGIIVSVISQLGDLIASVIKRKYGIKDYGKIFPGHGGVLDRFDSVLATSPIILILTLFPEFVALVG